MIDAQRKVLLDGQQFDNVILAVGDHFETVHRRHRMIANVIADANATIEQFHGQMLHMTVVQQNAILLCAAKHNCHIRLWLGAQRLHFHKRIVVHETDAGQIFASLARITGHTLAHIVRRLWIGLEANTVLALVILARRRLRIHHSDHWGAFAEFSRILFRTFACVVVDAVDTGAAVLAHMILAIVNVLRAVDTAIAQRTFARVVCKVIDAFGIVVAWIEFGRTEWNFRFAEFTTEAGRATARVVLHAVNAGGIILAFVLVAIVDVGLAAGARVTGDAFAAKTTLFQYGAGSIVATRIAEACVDHMLAVFAVIARFAGTVVLPLGLLLAHALILTGERVAGIAFRQNLIAHFTFAYKVIGWRGQQ